MSTCDLLSVAQASVYLNVKPSTIRSWILHRTVPYTKLGRVVRLKTADLNEMIEAGSVPVRPTAQYERQ